MADHAAERMGQLWRAIPWRYSVAAGLGAALAVYRRNRPSASGLDPEAVHGAHLGATGDLALGVRGVGTVPAVIYYALPPGVLAWSGWVVGRQGSETTTAQTGVVRGASIVAGYLPAVGLSLVVLAAGYAGTIVGISPLRVLVVAGVGFPLACGGVGGYAAGLSWDEKP